LKRVGADVTIDYGKDDDTIISEIQNATNNKLNLAMDAVAMNNKILAKLFPSLPAIADSTRLYITTNDWDPLPEESLGFKSIGLGLGPIGRPESKELNARIQKYNPVVYKLLESGKLQVGEYTVEGKGIEGIPKAWEVLKSGKAGSKKVVVEVADA
jgi:threonine dehydrogenase-like Zn-dependent dehydrogenase